MPSGTKYGLLTYHLNGGRKIHLLLSNEALWLSGRATKQAVELLRGYGQPLTVVKIGHIQPERAILEDVSNLLQDHIYIPRLTVRSQSHQLVFARVDLKARIIGEC